MNKFRFVLFVLTLAWAVVRACASTVAVSVPTPFGPNGADFYKGVDVVVDKMHGDAIVCGLGVTFMTQSNASGELAIDWSTLRNAEAYAFSRGIKVQIWRFGQDVQPYVYSGGKRVKNVDGSDQLSFWGRLNGPGWETKFRPPQRTWSAIATLIWGPAAKTLAANVPAGCSVRIVLYNEPGKGGNGDMRIGALADRKYPAEFASLPDGTIEPAFWTMARTMRYAMTACGIPTYLVSFEADRSAIGAVEASCCTGADFERAAAGCTGYGLNSYVRWNGSGLAPGPLIATWSTDTAFRFSRFASIPAFAGKRRAVVESNVMWDRLLPAQQPLIADYRCELGRVAGAAPYDFVGLFTLRGYVGCDFLNKDWSPIGAYVSLR